MSKLGDKHSYPEYYYSVDVQRLLSSKPKLPVEPIPPIEPPKPINPGEYKSGGNHGCSVVFFIAAIVGFIAILASDMDNKGKLIIPCIMLILLTFFMLKTERWDKDGHEKKKADYLKASQDYPTLQAQYQKDYEAYLKQKDSYDLQVRNILSEENLGVFRKDIVQKWRKNRTAPRFMPCDASDLIKKGASERMFVDELEEQGFYILINQKIPVGSKYYYPDILLIKDNLYIDIEIDEPYSGNDGTPIHYLEDLYGIKESVDTERNEYLVKKGFEIIRFSEEQVCLYPHECFRFITSFISSIVKGDKTPSCPDFFILKKWTKDQAFKLAYQRFRNTYVPVDQQKYISTEEYHSYEELRSEIDSN